VHLGPPVPDKPIVLGGQTPSLPKDFLSPLPPLPPVPRPSSPRPSPPRPRLAARPSNPFAAPMQYAFNSGHAPTTTNAPSTQMGPVGGGASALSAAGIMTDFAHAREGNPGPDFYGSLQSWWNAHSYYPREAAAKGEDGDVDLTLVVDRNGHVISVERRGSSGSMWLDLAGVSTWRDAKLLPLPDSLGLDHLTLDIKLHYILIRR
jgi:TonB family protein